MEKRMKIILNSDLLSVTDGIIIHQCNTTTKTTKGLAKLIFKKFPYASQEVGKEIGSISVFGFDRHVQDYRHYGHVCDGIACYKPHMPIIVNMYAQIKPGKNHKNKEDRLTYFKMCLDKLAEYCKDQKITNVNVPYKIGCGLAGGEWFKYKAMLQEFESSHDININIHKLD